MATTTAWTVEAVQQERPTVRVYDTAQRQELTGRIWMHRTKPHLAQIVYFRTPVDWGRPGARRVIWVTWGQLVHALNTDTPLTA